MLLVFLISLFVSTVAWAEEVPHAYILEAEKRYSQGDYEGSVRYLLAVPGVAQLAPKMTSLSKDDRAKLFFDLGCGYRAMGDSVRADQAFKEAFTLNDHLLQGYFKQADPGTFWWALLRNQEGARRLKTKRIFAAMRSVALPGWGQFYRGHTKKGYMFLGAVVVTSGVMGLQYRSFKNARSHYESIGVITDTGGFGVLDTYKYQQRYGNGDGTQYTEWEARHRQVKSGAKKVNVMLGILGVIWALNLADSAIFGPAPMGLTVSF